jgi:hypothetical protein
VFTFRGRSLLTHNLLKPVGPPDEWIKDFAEMLAQVIYRNNPAVGSKDIVIQEMDQLFRSHGIYDRSTDYPHVGHLVAALEARSEKKGADRAKGWIASALRVLRSLMVGSTRDAFCVKEGLSLDRLQKGVTVIELDGIGDSAAKALLVPVILQKLRIERLGGPERTKLEGLIVVEEAQHILSEGAEATSVIATACREIRSQGIGLVFVTQTPSAFSQDALANVNTLIIHRLVHPKDRSLALRLLGLDRQGDQVLDGLEVGQALVRTDKVSLVQVPRQERPWVKDDDLPETVAPLKQEVSSSVPQRTEVDRRTNDLSNAEWNLFLAIADGRAINPTGLSDLLGMSRGDLRQPMRRLVHKGLVGYAKAKKRGPGQPRTIYFLRSYGQDAYRAKLGGYPDRKSGAGDNQAEVVAAVVMHLGITRKPHKRFDILYDEDGKERAIEVETGSNDDEQILENVKKSLDFQGEARFVAVDEVTYNRVLQVCAQVAFDAGITLTLKLAFVEALPGWDEYAVRGNRSRLNPD